MGCLIGPFTQLLTMRRLPTAGPITDDALEVIPDGGLLVQDGVITQIGSYTSLLNAASSLQRIDEPSVCFPGFIDAHTHICFGGSRAEEYALRIAGHSYQEIAARGGGITNTVRATRAASFDELAHGMQQRSRRLLSRGVTTCEVKSGYGLSVVEELKMLRVIQAVGRAEPLQVVPTCLAAHTLPPEFSQEADYLATVLRELLPVVIEEDLARRVDIFVEKNAFSLEGARTYLHKAMDLGFDAVIHGDQFTSGGSALAAEVGALSVDHLEHITREDAQRLQKAGVIPVVLPGASLGLGQSFAPARMLLDSGLPLAIASDWNPGSAPMGDLLIQAALLCIYEKLSMAEVFAAMTVRAAHALRLEDRGVLDIGMRADCAVFQANDYREVLYTQGMMQPSHVVIGGRFEHTK